jgi:GAF domain-containing protein
VVDDDTLLPERKCLVSVVFDAQSSNNSSASAAASAKNEENSENDFSDKIRIPLNHGIAGYVAATGKTLNISNVYEDARFNPAIDLRTGYKTRSILCLPILDENGECIAVAEAINKLNDNDDQQNQQQDVSENGFTKNDEEVR